MTDQDEALRSRHRLALQTPAAFARDTSPLTGAMLDALVDWLADPPARGEAIGRRDEVIAICERAIAFLERGRNEQGWVSDIHGPRNLAAALHHAVLEGAPEVRELREYYATVGGDRDPTGDDFRLALADAVTAFGDRLFESALAWNTQLNETSRGLAWLLPACVLGSDAVALIEIGASAGLNLYAERRAFDIVWDGDEASVVRLGRGPAKQFTVRASGPRFGGVSAADRRGPEVISRVGGGIHLADPRRLEDQNRLAACVWGDQKARLDRLREAFEVDRSVRAEPEGRPAQLRKMRLPEDLPEFLAAAAPRRALAPVICVNTYVTAFLRDVEHRAVERITSDFARRWSLQHGFPWMWVRFEPTRRGEAPPPRRGYCRWVVELWDGNHHKRIELGWAHPHLHRVMFGDGLLELQSLGDAG